MQLSSKPTINQFNCLVNLECIYKIHIDWLKLNNTRDGYSLKIKEILEGVESGTVHKRTFRKSARVVVELIAHDTLINF